MKEKNKKIISKSEFRSIIKLASRPIREVSEKLGKKKADDYSGKQTRQRNTGDTSGKRSGRSH
jgi:hypothetical protein